MSFKCLLSSKFLPALVVLGGVAFLVTHAVAQQAAIQAANLPGLPDDWTHHHLVFSNPGTEEDAVRNGTYDQWWRIVNDPRYVIQQLKRRSPAQGPAASDVASIEAAARADAASTPEEIVPDELTPDLSPSAGSKAKRSKISKDWFEGLGSGTAATGTGTVNSNNASSGSTFSVGGQTFTASPPTKETGTFVMGSSAPNSGTTLVIGGITYNFSSLTLSASQSANTCGVETSTRSTTTSNLAGAMSNGSMGNSKGTGAWECNADVPTDSTLSVTSDSTSSHTITVQAVNAGSTGFGTANFGSTGFSWSSGSPTLGSDGTNSATAFAYWSGAAAASTSQLASNIEIAINDNASTGVSASVNGSIVTLTASAAGTSGDSIATPAPSFSGFTWGASTLQNGSTATVQPNAYPAKYGASLTSASCSDFAIYPTGQAGSSTAANIIAYDNLYATGSGAPCSGGPSVNWAYNTGTGETVTTSPIIYLDGKQIAFIESNGTAASLVLIKWAAESGESVTAPLTLTNSASGSAYHSCSPTASAPCMYTIAFAKGTNGTFSSPFYDYHGDALYVGDDSGNLHQFTAVFNGAPAENATSPWPVNLGTKQLSSPVYDPTWVAGGQVFVGDLGGVLHCVTASTGAIFGTTTPASGGQIADAPLINSSANYLLAFVNTSTSNTVYGYGEQFFPTSPGIVSVGTGATGYYLYAGAFDNVYYQSSNNTGNMYVVGNTGATTGATLYKVGLSSGVLSGAVTPSVAGLTPNSSGAYPWPSPVTEFCNPGSNSACALNAGGTATTTGTDYVFFSVNRGTVGGCTNTAGHGCVLSYNVSNPSSVAISASGSGLNVTTPTGNGCWATGGLVIDNSATTTGASQIYFVNLNGAAAGGGANGGTPTSSNCTSGGGPTINATQDSQSSP